MPEDTIEAATTPAEDGDRSLRTAAAATIRDGATKLQSQATDAVRGLADQGKVRAGDAIGSVVKLLRDAADTVDDRLGSEYGNYARGAADRVAEFSEQLQGKDVEAMLEDAKAFVRKSPTIAIGTAATVGFVLARLAKSGIDATPDTGR